MIFTTPLMLLGLAALPLLAAIYWLRSRSAVRGRVEPGLLDRPSLAPAGWADHPPHAGPALFLELLAIACCWPLPRPGPAVLKRELVRPFVVVLDDSYSMLASDSARGVPRHAAQAEAALAEEHLQRNSYVARFLRAVRPARGGRAASMPDCTAGSLGGSGLV